ncbi:DUF6221 family protein [Streptomyces sp. NPDC059906]|uniref:DUF6221 family protein n=1 Tax=Streptomyces sp. NPDC059906 TaxID=3346997 RepID=UPI00366902E0
MDDLWRWLGGQLEEDERIAKAAIRELAGPDAARWRYDGRHVETVSGPTEVAAGARTVLGPGVGEYIAHNDPARLLEELTAKHKLLGWVHRVVRPESPASADRGVRLLALSYADRPGYREEWRP